MITFFIRNADICTINLGVYFIVKFPNNANDLECNIAHIINLAFVNASRTSFFLLYSNNRKGIFCFF